MIHRVIFMTLYLAFKMYIDNIYISLKKWSTISGLPTVEIVLLEKCMLESLNYRLFIREEEFLHNFKSLRILKIEEFSN